MKLIHKDERGLTLIEVLAVLVILGIVAAVAFLFTSKVIQQSKGQAFVANAIAMKESATLHKRSNEVILDGKVEGKLMYQELIEEGYLEPLMDPYTNKEWTTTEDADGSFVEIRFEDNRLNYYVCLKSDTKVLCQEDGAGILSSELAVDKIKNRVIK